MLATSCIPVRPSIRPAVCPQGKLGSHRTDCYEIWHLCIFQKSAEKIQVSLKSDNNNGNVHDDQCTCLFISSSFLLRVRNVPDKYYRDNQNIFFVKKNSCCFWGNVEKYCRVQQVKYDNMAHAHCVLDTCVYKFTHLEYVMLVAVPPQQCLHDLSTMLRYTYIAGIWFSISSTWWRPTDTSS